MAVGDVQRLATGAAGSTVREWSGLGSAADADADDFQPIDSDLTAIAALTTTSYGRALLALADAAAGRTAFGLGTAATSASGDFQPVDSDLTAIAALTTTSFGRGLLALADAAALLSAAGAQAADADLTTIAGLTATTDNVLQSVGSAWASRTPAQLKATLALAKGDVGLGNVDNTADSAKTFAGEAITSGTVADARIASTLARDSEVTSAVAAEATLARNADNLASGTVAIARLPIDADVATLALPASTTISAFGATLVDDANAAAAIATLGLDGDLATLALPASTTISAFGATLVDDANAAAALATLGLDADIATLAVPASTTISAFGATLVDDAAASNARTTLALGNVDNTSDATKDAAAATLTNKTLTSPVINTPTITSPTMVDTDGWISASAEWVYVASNQFKVEGVDLTARYAKNTRIKCTNNSVTFYGVVIASSFSTDTTVTMAANGAYALANSAITAPFYSYGVQPPGYPGWFPYTTAQAVNPLTHGGYSAAPTSLGYVFSIAAGICTFFVRDGADGTSDSATTTVTLPVPCATIASFVCGSSVSYTNNSVNVTIPGVSVVTTGGTTVAFGLNNGGASNNFATSGAKRIRNATIIYPI